MDSAIVAAASLAHRYLTARKLPDAVSIYLVRHAPLYARVATDERARTDEASASIRVARDSQPEEVDRLSRMKLQLEIELTALRREVERNKKDDVSKDKIKIVEEQLSKIEEEISPILARYAVEKGKAQEIQSIKQVSHSTRLFSDCESDNRDSENRRDEEQGGQGDSRLRSGYRCRHSTLRNPRPTRAAGRSSRAESYGRCSIS